MVLGMKQPTQFQKFAEYFIMAGFRPNSEIIGKFRKLKKFMVILLSVKNDA